MGSASSVFPHGLSFPSELLLVPFLLTTPVSKLSSTIKSMQMVLLYLLIVLSLVPLGVFSAEGSFTPHTAQQPPGLDNFWFQEG